MRKADFIIIAAVTLVFLLYTLFSVQGATVSIYADGKLLAEKSLDEPSITEAVTSYGKNVVVVENNSVYISEADCPDKICMNGKISRAGQSLVCLPSRVSVIINGKAQTDVIVR